MLQAIRNRQQVALVKIGQWDNPAIASPTSN